MGDEGEEARERGAEELRSLGLCEEIGVGESGLLGLAALAAVFGFLAAFERRCVDLSVRAREESARARRGRGSA